MKCGAATRVLNLKPGHPLGGYADRAGDATGTSGNLTARAIAIGNGDAPGALIIALDLLHSPSDLVHAVTARISEDLGLAPQQILVNAIHTHCGPRDITYRADADLVRLVAATAADAAVEASLGMAPVRVISSTASGIGIAHNRRDATEYDDDAQLVVFERMANHQPTGQPVATIVNMACHPTVLSADTLTYDPDFVGPLRQCVELSLGGVCVYLQGFAGDANPVYLDRSTTEARRVGTRAGAAVLRELTAMLATGRSAHLDDLSLSTAVKVAIRARRLHDGDVTTAQRSVEVVPRDFSIDPERPLASESARAAEAWVTGLLRESHGHFLSSDPLPQPNGPCSLPVQAITVGDTLAILAIPGEPLHSARAAAVAQLPGRHVLTLGYSNAAIGYLPGRDEFERSGYEIGATRFAPGTLESLVDAAVALVLGDTSRNA